MLWFLLIVVLGVAAYRYRVKLLAKVLGQPERRIERADRTQEALSRSLRSRARPVVDGVRRGVGVGP